MNDNELLIKYLNENKIIKDKEIAKKLLIISPKVWKLLSNELKEDEELMLLYQPSYCLIEKDYYNIGFLKPDCLCIYYDYGFKINLQSIVYPGYLGVQVKSILPNFILNKNEKFKEAYINIQKSIGRNEIKIDEEKFNKLKLGKAFYIEKTNGFVDVFPCLQGVYKSIYFFKKYNRTNLDRISEIEYKKYMK